MDFFEGLNDAQHRAYAVLQAARKESDAARAASGNDRRGAAARQHEAAAWEAWVRVRDAG